MSWTKLGDEQSERLWDLSDAAFRLHVHGLVYCNRWNTDGHIPNSRLAPLVPNYDPAHLTELLTARLWETVDGGYSIIDFLKDQPSKAQVEARRAETTRRVAQWRQHHGNAVTKAVSNDVGTGTGVNDVRSTRTRGNGVTRDEGDLEEHGLPFDERVRRTKARDAALREGAVP